MKKLNLLALSALMASSWLTAGAQDLGQATSVLPELTTTTTNTTYYNYTVDNGYSVGTTSLMLLSWGGQELTYTESGGGKDGGTIALQGGSNPNLKYYLNSTNANGTGSSKTLCMYLSAGTLTNGVTYTFTVPEGLVQNEAGQTNPAQTFTFTRGTGGYISSTSYASFNKIPSIINTTAQGTVYSASDLKNFEVTCLNGTTGVWTLEPATDASYEIQAIEKTSGQIVNLTSKFSIKDGKIVGDLSSLTPGSWNVFLPQGYAHYYNASNALCVVSGVLYNFDILDESAFQPLPEEVTVYGATIGTALPQYNSSFPTALNVSWNGQPMAVADDAPVVTLTSGNLSYDCTLAGASKVTNGQTEYCLKVTPPSPAPTAGGLYTLTIPAGTVKSGSYENKEVTYSFYFTPATNNVVITPTPGTVALNGFTGITLEFPGATDIAQADQWATQPTLTVPGASAANLVLGESIKIDGNKIVVPVANPTTGNYVLNIPANAFVIDNAALSPVINKTFTVADGLSQATVIEGPKPFAPASTATYATTNFNLELTWDYEAVAAATDPITVNYTGGSFQLTAADGGYEFVSVPDANGNAVEGTNAVKLNIGETLNSKITSTNSAGNTVTVTLPAGWVKNSAGKASPAQTFTFTAWQPVEAQELVPFEPSGKTPIEGQFQIKYGPISYLLATDNNAFITVTDENGVETALRRVTSSTLLGPGTWYTVTADALVFDISNLPKGKYTVNVPQAVFKEYSTSTGGSSYYFANAPYTGEFTYGTPIDVTLNLSSEGLDVENLSELVDVRRITDPSEGTMEALSLDGDSYSLTYYEPTGFYIAPVEGYVVKVTASSEDLDEYIMGLEDYSIISLEVDQELFNNAVFTATIEKYIPPTTDVTLNYVAEEGVEGDFWKYVTVVYEELSTGEGLEGTPTTVNPESATTTFTLTPTATISFEPTEGYLVSVTTEADEDVVEVKNGNVTSATIFFGAPAEVAFNVSVSVDPDYVTPVDVTLNFSNGIGVEDAWKLVSVEVSDTEGESNPVVDGSEVTFTVNPEATITFNVTEGYMLSVATSETDETVVIDGNEITIAAHAPAEVSFTVTVSVAPIDVTLNFTAGEDVEEDPWSVVSVAVKDAEGESAPTVNENPFTFGVYPSATISFTAAEGYLVSVTAETEDAVVVNENEVTITIGAPETVELNVEVTLEESDAIHGINVENIEGEVYTLQGLRVKSGKLAPGIYIINGKKVAVK